MKNKQLIKNVIIGTGVGFLALLGVGLTQVFAADTNSSAPAATAPAASATTIDDVLVSDEPNKDGYVLKSKDKVSAQAAKIYATVQLGSAVQGQKVIATLTYHGNNAQIGPVVAKVGTTGDTMEAFSFSTTPMPWPKGEYQVDISLDNGATKSVSFTVGD